jgi:hypothetical protein
MPTCVEGNSEFRKHARFRLGCGHASPTNGMSGVQLLLLLLLVSPAALRKAPGGPVATDTPGQQHPDPGIEGSAYAQAQVTAERHGLRLDTGPILEDVHRLQLRAGRALDRQVRAHAAGRVRRVTLMAITAIALWLSVLITMIERAS